MQTLTAFLIPTPLLDHDHLRELGDLTTMGDSLLTVGQLQPIVVKENGQRYTVIAGNRRVAAAKLVGFSPMKAILQDFAPENKTLAQIAENNVRKQMTTLETVTAIFKAKTEFPDRQNQDIAKATGCRPSEVSKCLAVAACAVTMEALEAGKIDGLEAAYTIAKADDKEPLLALLAGGATVKQLIDKAKAKPKGETEKVKRVKLVFPCGSVTVEAKELDIETLAEILGLAGEQTKKARKDNLGITTFARATADKARAKP